MPDDLLFYVKSKGKIKISHLCLAALVLLTRTVRSYPFSAGGWVSKELSFLFFICQIKSFGDWRFPCLVIRQTWGLLVADSFIALCLALWLVLNAHRSILVTGSPDKGTHSFLGYPFFHPSWLNYLNWIWLMPWLALKKMVCDTGHVKWHVRPVDIYMVNKHLYWYIAHLCGYCTVRGLLLLLTSMQWYITDYLGT